MADAAVNFTGKRILITQSSLRLLAGSEINTLELARHLKKQGAKVTVYTYFFSDPIAAFFHKYRIKVTINHNKLKLNDFDYVWVHHQVVPISFIEELTTERGHTPQFIFLHMSGLESHYLEQAYIWHLEQRIASKILFVSGEAKENIYKNSFDPTPFNTGLYRNPVPLEFISKGYKPRRVLRKILIVSNHPAKEVLDAKSELEKHGYFVTFAGQNQEEYKLIESIYLKGYDVVITIGKTVQYSLVTNVPVYIYDIWGGPGYLNKENEKTAAYFNYSGRGFGKKNGKTIADEVVNGYREAVDFQNANQERFIKEFSLSNVLLEVFSDIKPRSIKPFSKYYKQYLLASLTMLKYKFYHENILSYRELEIEHLQQQIINSSVVANKISLELIERRQEITNIYASRSYRVGAAVLKPFRVTKRFLFARR